MQGIHRANTRLTQKEPVPKVASNVESPSSGEQITSSQTQTCRQKQIAAGVWSNAARLFFALWYLLGSLVHVKYGLTNNHIYEIFGRTSMFVVSRELWASVVMPHVTYFALLLAAFEMATGILILSKGRLARIGLAASVLFNLFLVQLGLGFPEVLWSGRDFVLNRLTCLLFAILQLPLFWVSFDLSFPGFLHTRRRLQSSHPPVADMSRIDLHHSSVTGQKRQKTLGKRV